MRLIEEMIRLGCHDGRVIGRVADKVKDTIHEAWLRSDYELRCELLRLLKGLDATRMFVRKTLRLGKNVLDKWLRRCNINWESKAARGDVIKSIETVLREKFGWDKVKMCEGLMRFIGVDTETFRKYGIELCDWVYAGFDEVYFMGITLSDLYINLLKNGKHEYVFMKLDTTNAVSAVLFPMLLQPIRRPSIIMAWDYRANTVEVIYFITVESDKWGWLNREELIKRIKALRLEDVPRLIGGAVDGDGTLGYNFTNSEPYVKISACKTCEKRAFLNVLQEALEKLGIEGRIYEKDHEAKLELYGKNAIKLLRLVMPYLRHPLKRLRAKLILMLHGGKIDYETFTELYKQTEYEDENDPKRGHAVEALARAAPQTHTHGGISGSPALDSQSSPTSTMYGNDNV
jgi:hypothetical protein